MIFAAWILPVTFIFVLWYAASLLTQSRLNLTRWSRAARMSIIFSVIRIANHSGHKCLKQITYLISVSFACMWAALIAQKMTVCELRSCVTLPSVALLELISQCLFVLSVARMVLTFFCLCSGLLRGYFPRCCATLSLEQRRALA